MIFHLTTRSGFTVRFAGKDEAILSLPYNSWVVLGKPKQLTVEPHNQQKQSKEER